jgi:hypothetical protein
MYVSAISPRLLYDIDRFHVAIVPAGYEIRNGMENDSCAGIEVVSAVLLRALLMIPDEGVLGYMVLESQNPHPVAQNATRVGHPFV